MSESKSSSGGTRPDNCDLCGLSLRRGQASAEFGAKTYSFCCLGCRQVFAILMESSESRDPQHFRDSEIFKECIAAGILPASEKDLDLVAAKKDRQDPPPSQEDKSTWQSTP